MREVGEQNMMMMILQVGICDGVVIHGSFHEICGGEFPALVYDLVERMLSVGPCSTTDQ
jgi:hypothetical protein